MVTSTIPNQLLGDFPPDHLRGALRRGLLPSIDVTPRGRHSFASVELTGLPEAGLFSEDPAIATLPLIREWRKQPASQLLNELVAGAQDEFADWRRRKPGRPPIEGDWPSLYLAFVASRSVAIEPFFSNLAEQGLLSLLLDACGFSDAPSRQSVDLHFAALEEHWEAFIEVAQELMRHAQDTDPQIGVHVFTDGSAFSSASTLTHECHDLEGCLASRGKDFERPARATLKEVGEEHYRESEQPEPDLDVIEDAERTRGPIIVKNTERGPVEYREIYIKSGGFRHRFVTRDLASGVRAYRTGKFWLGGSAQTAVDMHTGLGIAQVVIPNDVQEWDAYPALYEQMTAALGHGPRTVSVDRGYVNQAFAEFNARRGTAVVAPFRARKKNEKLWERRTDLADENGVPRCRFCGGPGDQLSPAVGPAFSRSGEPYIRFRCLVPRTHDCRRTQHVLCSTDWVQLPLLSRESELFHAIRHARHNKEGNFNYDRHRYGTIGQEGLGCLCRSGIEVHRLRCSAAMLLNWFRFSLRQGLVEPVELDVTPNTVDPVLLSERRDPFTGRVLSAGVGTDNLNELLRYRDEHQLELPYGAAAERLRLAYQKIG